MTLKEKLENHPSKSDLFIIMDNIVQILGEHKFIEELCRALSYDEFKEDLEHIIRAYDLGNEDLYDKDDENYNF